MEYIYILDQTVEHLTNAISFDAKLIPFPGSDDISIFLTSKEIDLEGRTFKFKSNIKDSIVRDFLYADVKWPIFSKRMSAIIDSFSPEYRKFNVELNKKNGEILQYQAYQILPRPDLIDFSRSDVVPNPNVPNFISRVNTLAFTKNIEQAPQIFRLKEFPIKLFLRQDLANQLLDAKLEGVIITSNDDFDWRMS